MINGHILDNIALYHPGVTYGEEKLYRNIGGGRFVDATKTQDAGFRAPRVRAQTRSATTTMMAGSIFW